MVLHLPDPGSSRLQVTTGPLLFDPSDAMKALGDSTA